MPFVYVVKKAHAIDTLTVISSDSSLILNPENICKHYTDETLLFQWYHTSFNNYTQHTEHEYNLSGWNAVLDQLATETDINTVRLYVMDCRYDYTSFIDHAAKLGIYVMMVPLTTIMGPGVLSRDKIA